MNRPSQLDGVQGKSETRREMYRQYIDRALELLTQHGAKNTSGANSFAGRQRSVLRLSGGYTIVEAMLFLGVTGVLLISALAVFQGQSTRTQFTQGIREMDVRLRTTINEVGSGYYPNSAEFSCSRDATTGVDITNITSSEQGTNEECVFLGKILQFDADSYRIYTLVGPRQVGSSELDSLDSANPAVVAVESGTGPDITEEQTLPAGIQIDKVVVDSDEFDGELGAIGFVMSLAKYQGSDPVSGSQSIDVVNLRSSDLGGDKGQIIDQVALLTDEDRGTHKTTICMSDGASRKAAIVIGGEGRQATSEVFLTNIPGECS
ncbi:hypothetical protein KA047_03680 [Candidatus Saccharibacteria bacterium]|nr:hypothetical protein [Candidatus Saccharibacteria bacterium]